MKTIFWLYLNINIRKTRSLFFQKSLIGNERSEIDKLYLSYKTNHSVLTIGKFFRDITSENSDFSSGSLIESENSFKPLRINIASEFSIKDKLLFQADFSHGVLEKIPPIWCNPYIHEKSLYSNFL